MKLLIIYLSFFTTFIYLSPTYYASADDVVEVAATPPTPIFTRLIHRDSIYSPYYNPNSTAEDRAKNDLKRSMIRLEYVQTKIQNNTGDFRAGLIAEDSGAGFLVNVSIGDPAVPQLMIMDTGSSLLWIQCRPCKKCFRQSSPLFDPSKSSTYTNLSCTNSYCTSLTGSWCDQFNSCQYYESYADGTDTSGNLAAEKFTLDTSEEGTITAVLVVFGCGHENNGYSLGDQTSGILGLGSEAVSLVTQLGSKFSYCIGNISDPKYSHNLLILGDEAVIQGASSTLERYKGFYYVALVGISVGTRRLKIDPNVFQRKRSGEGGVIIDTGSAYTLLTKGAYEPLRDEVEYLVKLQKISDPQNPSRLCFIGNIARDLQGFPTVTFHFAGGAQLVLDTGSFFREYTPTIFCMAVIMTSVSLGLGQDISLIGVMAQQNYNVGYDLRGNTISINRVDCMHI